MKAPIYNSILSNYFYDGIIIAKEAVDVVIVSYLRNLKRADHRKWSARALNQESYFLKKCTIDTISVKIATTRDNISYKLMASPPWRRKPTHQRLLWSIIAYILKSI